MKLVFIVQRLGLVSPLLLQTKMNIYEHFVNKVFKIRMHFQINIVAKITR